MAPMHAAELVDTEHLRRLALEHIRTAANAAGAGDGTYGDFDLLVTPLYDYPERVVSAVERWSTVASDTDADSATEPNARHASVGRFPRAIAA